MSVETRAAAGVASAADSELAILTALAIERAALPRATARDSVSIVQCGPGGERAAAAAAEALARGARALLSWGFAGGLRADVDAGTVVLPRAIVTSTGDLLACDSAWQAALAAALEDGFRLDDRPLFGAARPLATPGEKRAAAALSDAAAVDMESAAIAAAAAARGARFAAVRVIFDTARDALPAFPERWIDTRGNRRYAPLLGAAFAPAEWGVLWNLGKRYRVARAVLGAVAGRIARARFLLPNLP